jgi:hypothetical protein
MEAKMYRPKIALKVALFILGIVICAAIITYRALDTVSTSAAAQAVENSVEESIDNSAFSMLPHTESAAPKPVSIMSERLIFTLIKENIIGLLLMIVFVFYLVSSFQRKIMFSDDMFIVNKSVMSFDEITCYYDGVLSTKNHGDIQLKLDDYSGENRFEIEERLKQFSPKS